MHDVHIRSHWGKWRAVPHQFVKRSQNSIPVGMEVCMYDQTTVQHIRESAEGWEATDVQKAAARVPERHDPLPPSLAHL